MDKRRGYRLSLGTPSWNCGKTAPNVSSFIVMQEKILDFLRKTQNYASGEEISQRLGISRQALWKHIQEFKELGYDIVAVPHLGYRLISTPDRLFPAEISH